MDLKKLEELIELFEASGLCELEVEEDGYRMRLQKPQPTLAAQVAIPIAPPPVGPASAAPDAQPTPAASEPEQEAEQLPTIDSPMVGTFYVASAPGEDSFVQVGSKVDENQTVCIVEAMKLMNEVGAKFACTIEKVLVENGEPVEFGQPLFAVRPLE